MEGSLNTRTIQRERRVMRVRKKLKGTKDKPRLSVLKTNKHLFAQLIDDENSITLKGIGTFGKESAFGKKSKTTAKEIGKALAAFAKENKIQTVVFDRGRYQYHGLVAEIANGAREGGLKF